ncbi:MAG: DUF1800 domain-containing protein [Planctomycetes bacterium]|nr:DUF1800 domain-containing protein [Planctomycetota bacterium]MCB9916822.1 DUF1800 domain-containing protein [Planctomycetota bacterium]
MKTIAATLITTAVLGLAPHAYCAAVRDDASLEALPEAEFDLDAARHLLMRAGFGASLEEAKAFHALGLSKLVDLLVDYEDQPDVIGPFVWRRNEPLPSRREIVNFDENERRAFRNRLRREDRVRITELKDWWVRRMLETKRPLEERMTLFWHGHFTTSYRDVRDSKLVWLQNELLRSHATGNFGELLHEISRDPAMLAYLNNNQNRKGKPNENYAREVMELFSLGIGNYDEKDIKEVARAFTGWTFDRRTARFIDARRQHDTGVKTIFGQEGRFDGADVCDLLLAHDACAPYIAGKIFAYFAFAPDRELAGQLGRVLAANRFEMKPLLRRIFKSRAFYSHVARGTQVKSPVVLLVSTIRTLGMPSPNGSVIAGAAARLGQELFGPPNVRGWEGGLAWITTSSLLERDNVCGNLVLATGIGGSMDARGRGRGIDLRALQQMLQRRRSAAQGARGRVQPWSACRFASSFGATTIEELVDGLAGALLMVPLAPGTRAEILAFARGDDGSLPVRVESLEGVDMERKLREVLHLLMSSPEFQVC